MKHFGRGGDERKRKRERERHNVKTEKEAIVEETIRDIFKEGKTKIRNKRTCE